MWLEAKEGDEVTDRRPVAESCLLRSGRALSIDGRLELATEVSRAGATAETEVTFAVVALMLRVLRLLRFEEERWRRADVGTTLE
jgi:hypothetical protein